MQVLQTKSTGVQPIAKEKTKYSDAELSEFKEIILQKIEVNREELLSCKQLLGETTDDRASIGDGSYSAEREELSTRAGRAQKFIKQLEYALVRIENKTYGICSSTGKLIAKERLRAVPHTTQCYEAKQKAA